MRTYKNLTYFCLSIDVALSSCAPKIAYTTPQLSYSNSTGIFGAINAQMIVQPTLFSSGLTSLSSCGIKTNSVNAANFPSSLSIDPQTCVITGTPTAPLSATQFDIIATSANGTTSSDAYVTLTISPCDASQTAAFGYGSGVSTDPYLICSNQQLQNIGNIATVSSSFYYSLVLDLNLSGFNFSPIGTSANPFEGVFDGGSHTISNLTINQPGNNFIALVGFTSPGAPSTIVRNFTMTNVNMNGANSVAGAVGYVNGGGATTISNVKVSGLVQNTGVSAGGVAGTIAAAAASIINSSSSATIIGNQYVGGLVGQLNPGIISGSSSSGSVTGASYVGGLVGVVSGNPSPSSITLSYSTANSVVSPAGGSFAGGLLGATTRPGLLTITGCYATGTVSNGIYEGGFLGATTATGIFAISNSYSTGKVTGTGILGGFVGQMLSGSTITNSYSLSPTIGSSGATYIGALVGNETNNSGTQITNSFAAGAVSSASGTTGGLVAHCTGTSCGTASSSYYDTNTTGQSASQDTNNLEITSAMLSQGTYAGWDFTSTWYPPTATSYPTLH